MATNTVIQAYKRVIDYHMEKITTLPNIYFCSLLKLCDNLEIFLFILGQSETYSCLW